jgi:hypothetical protein
LTRQIIGGVEEAVQEGFETVEASGKKIKYVAFDSEFLQCLCHIPSKGEGWSDSE